MEQQQSTNALNIALWVVQGFLAIAFLMAGFAKIGTPVDELANSGMTFVDKLGTGMVRFIGVCEMLGGLGLLLPALLRIKPFLTAYAAAGLATIMALATIYHISQQEMFIHTTILMVLAGFIAWGRLKKVPIKAK